MDNKRINQYLNVAKDIESLTESQFHQISLFKERIKNNTKLVTFNYDNDFNQKVSILTDEWGENLSNDFINMYYFFRESNIKKESNFQESEEKSFNWMIKKEKTPDYNSWTKKRTFDGNGMLRLVEYYDEKSSFVKFEELDEQECLHRRVFMESGFNSQELYYRKDGSCYLSRINIRKSGEILEQPEFLLFDTNGEIAQKFKGSLELYHYFLNLLVDKMNTVIVAHQMDAYEIMETYYSDYGFKIYFVNQSFENILEDSFNPSLLDGIVFSTHLEREEAIKELGSRNNYFVMPPFYKSHTNNFNDKVKSDKVQFFIKISENEMVLLEQVIRAFRIAMDKYSNAVLHICGTDIIDQTNIDLIENLDLAEHVEFHGAVQNMDSMYQISDISILLNASENDGLNVFQSLSAGCPVISYNKNYLVNEIITDGGNGFIIENESIKDLSDALVKTLCEPELLEDMKNEAFQSSNKYSLEDYVQSWSGIESKIVDNSSKRTLVDDMTVYLLDCGWTESRHFHIHSKLSLSGQTNELSRPSINLILINREDEIRIVVPGEIKQIDRLNYDFHTSIDFPSMDLPQDTWDASLTVEWENCFLQRRIGNMDLEEITDKLRDNLINNRIITPYPTIKGHRLSFKVGRFIPEKDEINRLENLFN